MDSREFTFINEEFHAAKVRPEDLDKLLSAGWRHFGKYFFRYSIAFHENKYRKVMPLRIRLAEFSLTKSLRRILRKNGDLHFSYGPAVIDDEKHRLFDIHKQRFKGMRPGSLLHFLDPEAGKVPCESLEFRVRNDDGDLVAVSFADQSSRSFSAIYAMFDPEYSSRSLGILTILLEIEQARDMGKSFYYLGYAYEGNSFYDYKKRFRGIERYDWNGNWERFEV
ncbi:MAG: GNAT family N-acetyltransferase [Acidobacteria bacterium]|nr:MAG: GNAT family N-acetyltransferase [Acidobacteriota bacterium]REK02925.1 MAG: GNAT family N-acetyltransferase [Acidobacteriota bacterium]REK13271.1 MAG: GNAT family N-acetyltransferase [Acidobacteriota bacterium]REK41265.1 MAG: GNAT family N-acetyltransferase [Acidobacteriota bacterium]